jgi:dTDP-glucose 4,6-dehydratase
MQYNLPKDDLNELMELKPSPWNKLFKANIFITGATGLFGEWMIGSLLYAMDKFNLKSKMTLLVRDHKKIYGLMPHIANRSDITLLEGDILNFKFPKDKFSYIVHLAAPHPIIQNEDPLGALDILMNGTRRVLDFATFSNPKSLLYISSGSVYGRHVKNTQTISEECREAPDPLSGGASAYDEGKRVSELLCGIYFRKKNVFSVIGRCFSFIGPLLPLNEHYAVGNFIKDSLEGDEIKVTGDGTPIRSFLYLSDLAWWLWVILVNGTPGRAYNVGSDESINLKDLAHKISKCFNPPIPVNICKRPESGTIPHSYIPSIKRAEEELGLYSRIRLDEAILRTIRWYSEKT